MKSFYAYVGSTLTVHLLYLYAFVLSIVFYGGKTSLTID